MAVEELVPAPPVPSVPAATGVAPPSERAARRALRSQIAKLERDLAEAFVTVYPRVALYVAVPTLGGPRVLSLGELERVRDDLAMRVREARTAIARRAEEEERSRLLIEQMLLEPARHKWVRVSNEDIGERGCRHWHVRPRLGLLGMLLGWWRVKLSSGCPLGWGSGHPAATPPLLTSLLGPPQPQTLHDVRT